MREIAMLVRADGTFVVQARDVEGGCSYPVAKGFVDEDPRAKDADNFVEIDRHVPKEIDHAAVVEAAAWLAQVIG